MAIQTAIRSTAPGLSLITALAILFALGKLVARAQASEIPSELRGDWVPSAAGCQSPARFRVSGDRMTLINGADNVSYGNLMIVLQPEPEGISVISVPEFSSGYRRFTVIFNANELQGLTQLHFHQESKDVTHSLADGARALTNELAGRFPLTSVPLIRCSGQ